MRRWITSMAMLLAAAAALGSTPDAAQAQAAAERTLYQRLGGYDAVAAVVDDFLGGMAADPQLGRFFQGLGTDRMMQARQLTVDFVCNAAGGPCFYTGRDMLTSHKGMGINESDWDRAGELLVGTLNKFNVPEAEKQEVLTLVASLKGPIVDTGR